MNKNVIRYFPVFLALLILVLCTAGCTNQSDDQNNPAIEATITEDTEFGSVTIQVSAKELKNAGFDYGDSCALSFSNGFSYENVPFFNGYYGKTNKLVIVDYQGSEYIQASRCSGDSLWEEADCKEGDSVTITLQKKGRYLLLQKAMNMTYSDDRNDYESDEVFANYRELACNELVDGRFYRGASPVDNRHNRAETVDSLLEESGIQFVLDLADTEEDIQEYQKEEDFDSDYYMSLYRNSKVSLLGLTASYRSEDFMEKLAGGLTEMINSEGPYYIHCTEGKDRTGFVCILLKCAAGCSLEDIEADYMKTYENYFGFTESSNPEKYQAIMDNRFYDMINWLAGVEKSSDLKDADFQKAAKDYLIKGGMSEADFLKLQSILIDKSFHNKPVQ